MRRLLMLLCATLPGLRVLPGQDQAPSLEGIELESSLATLRDLRSRAFEDPSRLAALERATWELLLRAAQQARNSRLRLQLLRDAADVIDEHLLHPGLLSPEEPRRTLAVVLHEASAGWSEESERTGDRDRQHLCRKEAARALGRGLRVLQDALTAERARATTDPREAVRVAQLQLLRAVLLRDLAALATRDRATQLHRARTELTDLVLGFGEETWLGLAARLELFRGIELEGRREEAAAGYRGVLEELTDLLGATTAAAPRRHALALVQRSLSYLVALLQAEGRPEELLAACARVLPALDAAAAGEEPVLDRTLDRIRCHHACVLLEGADPGPKAAATQTLLRVARDHAGFPLGALAAQRLHAPGPASGASWQRRMEQAIEELRQGHAARAAEALQALLADPGVPPDPAQRQAAALDLALARQAAADFTGAAEAFRTAHQMAEHDPDARLLALDRMAQCVARLPASRPVTTADAQLAASARWELARYATGDDSSASAYLEGTQAFDRGRFSEALAWMVKPEAPIWPLARARQGICLVRTNDLPNGITILREAMRLPAMPAPGGGPLEAAARRAAARLAAWEIAASGVQELATGRPAGDDLEPALEVLWHSLQADAWIPEPRRAAMGALQVRAQLEQGRLGPALRLWPIVRHMHGGAFTTSQLAALLFQSQLPRIAALRREWDLTRARDTWERLQGELRQALLFALDHLELERVPAFPWLRRVARLAMDAGEHGVAERVLELTEEQGRQPERRDAVEQYVRPDLVEVRLRRQDYQRALELVGELRERRAADPRLLELHLRALGGWVERGADGQLVRVTALGRPREALGVLRAAADTPGLMPAQHTLAWYRLRLLELWFLVQEPGQAEAARSLGLGDEGLQRLRSLGAEGEALLPLFLAIAPR